MKIEIVRFKDWKYGVRCKTWSPYAALRTTYFATKEGYMLLDVSDPAVRFKTKEEAEIARDAAKARDNILNDMGEPIE